MLNYNRELSNCPTNASNQEAVNPRLPDLLEIIDGVDVKAKWQVLSELLNEALEQEHFITSFAAIKIDDSDPNWQDLIGTRGYMRYGLEGETLYINPANGVLRAREKISRDRFQRLVALMEVIYDNSEDNPLATENPLELDSYSVDYATETESLDASKILHAKYKRNQAEQAVATHWVQPPPHLVSGLEHIKLLEIWTTRKLHVKYFGDTPVAAAILEYNSVPTPPMEKGVSFLLMRSISGKFQDGRLVALKAFERLGLNQLQKELNMTRSDAGYFEEELTVAND